MPFLVRSRKSDQAPAGRKASDAGGASSHRAAVDKIAQNRTRSDVAGFLLAPIQRPDVVMEVLIERMRTEGFLVPRQHALTGGAGGRSRGSRIALRAAAVVCVFMFLSCAVAPNHGLWNLASLASGPGKIEPVDGAIAAGLQAAGMLLEGDSLPPELANTFAGRLLSGNWSGIMLIGPDGQTKSVAKGDRSEQVENYVARQQRLEDENMLLNEALAAIRATEQSRKIYLEINLEDNKLKVKLGTTTMYEFPIVSGKGYAPRESGRGGRFATPRGILRVQKKEVDPVWYPPDWHWTERGLTPPTSGRNGVRGHLGKYRLNLGHGYGIHGTTAGRIRPGKYSHGCIRMNATDLETVFKLADVGTEVFIY